MRYQTLGLEGLNDKGRSGRPSKLSAKEQQTLIDRIQAGPLESDDVSVFKGKSIRQIIETELGVNYALASIYDVLKRLKFKRIKPRPQHEKNDPKAMDKWKNEILPAKYEEVRKQHPDKSLEVWFQDEMRFGEKTRISSGWKLSGTSWRQQKQIGFRNQYIYGAVNPQNGDHVGLVFSECSTEAMNIHLGLVSQQIGANAHAILVMDRAGWHSRAKDLIVPPNITILDLPPYSPELNPVERVWLWLKENFLSNIIIKKGEDLTTLGCKVWSQLTNEVVKSICHERYLAFTNFS